MSREYFHAYHSYIEAMEPLNDAERGRLFMACLTYSMTGEAPKLRGNERFVFHSMKSQIDRDAQNYAAKCERNRENILQRYTTVYDRIRPPTKSTKEKEKEKAKEKEKDNNTHSSQSEYPHTQAEPKHKHGEFGWVKLTESQYAKLVEDLGEEELQRCIRYVDESAQKSGNRNKWKDWNLVIRHCSRDKWGAQGKKANAQAQEYMQREYAERDFQHLIVDLDGELSG